MKYQTVNPAKIIMATNKFGRGSEARRSAARAQLIRWGKRAVNQYSLLILMTALGLLSACQTPTEPDVVSSAAETRVSASSVSSMHVQADAVVVEASGTVTAFDAGREGFEIVSASENKIAVLVTGSATFSHPSVPQLRLNVRQTEGGVTRGSGAVTFHSYVTGQDHTTDVQAVCVKPVSGWGRTNYGITMELDEPYSPYGSGPAYTHVIVSVTEDGHLDPSLVMNTRSFCGGSISFYPPENRVLGNIQVLFPGQ